MGSHAVLALFAAISDHQAHQQVHTYITQKKKTENAFEHSGTDSFSCTPSTIKWIKYKVSIWQDSNEIRVNLLQQNVPNQQQKVL